MYVDGIIQDYAYGLRPGRKYSCHVNFRIPHSTPGRRKIYKLSRSALMYVAFCEQVFSFWDPGDIKRFEEGWEKKNYWAAC